MQLLTQYRRNDDVDRGSAGMRGQDVQVIRDVHSFQVSSLVFAQADHSLAKGLH